MDEIFRSNKIQIFIDDKINGQPIIRLNFL